MHTRTKASAPAKVILLGEHFVVHGEPAIVFAIDKRATVTAELRSDERVVIESNNMGISGFFLGDEFYAEEGGKEARNRLEPIYLIFRNLTSISKKTAGANIRIDSSFPVAAGLGSSAAVAVASVAALSRLVDVKLTKDEIFKLALEAEKMIHGNPSGIDPAVSTYGGVLLYRKGKKIRPLNVRTDLSVVICDTMTRRSTGEMVARVGELKGRYPSIIENISKASGETTMKSIEALQSGDLETLGELMNINHGLLCAIGVSNQHLEDLIYAARKSGALGAKLTGAGGGGCTVALATTDRIAEVAKAMERAGGKAFITNKTTEGVRTEE